MASLHARGRRPGIPDRTGQWCVLGAGPSRAKVFTDSRTRRSTVFLYGVAARLRLTAYSFHIKFHQPSRKFGSIREFHHTPSF